MTVSPEHLLHSESETPDAAVWAGVRALIDNFVSPAPTAYPVIIYTADARQPAAWISAELRTRGYPVKIIRMSMYDDDTLQARLVAALPEPGNGDVVSVITVERTSMANSTILRTVLAPFSGANLSVTRIINASAEFFLHSLNVTPAQLNDVNAGLLNRMMPAETLRITSSSGTDLEVRLNSGKYRWVSNRGLWRAGGFTILPPGEVATLPADVNGTLVADGAFNITAHTEMDVRLTENPVTVEISNGRMQSFSSGDPLMHKLFGRFSQYENFERVGELGFGTNFGTGTFIAMNSHINERHPGLHIGLGNHGQRPEVAGYSCAVHLDLITSDSVTTIDGGEEIDSKRLAQTTGVHPPLQLALHDEDIDALDGDCCGTWAISLTGTGAL